MVIDAPDTYKHKLVAEGKAVWVEAVQAQESYEGGSGESSAPVSAASERGIRRKKVL
jgi:hypothetical protein